MTSDQHRAQYPEQYGTDPRTGSTIWTGRPVTYASVQSEIASGARIIAKMERSRNRK